MFDLESVAQPGFNITLTTSVQGIAVMGIIEFFRNLYEHRPVLSPLTVIGLEELLRVCQDDQKTISFLRKLLRGRLRPHQTIIFSLDGNFEFGRTLKLRYHGTLIALSALFPKGITRESNECFYSYI